MKVNFDYLLGKHIDDVEVSELEKHWIVRILRPDNILAMELRDDRLNIFLDENNVVKRIRPG